MRFVAFASIADNLVPGDTNFSSDVFVRDRRTGTVERVSVGPLGAEGDGNSGMLAGLGAADISRDGRYVAFASEASNFALGDQAGTADVFVHDRLTHTTELVSRGRDGFPAGGSTAPSISGDGRFVGFESNDVTLVRNDANGFSSDAFVFDRERRRLQLVSRNDDGEQGNDDSFGTLVSDDGETVVFSSRASNLSRRDINQAVDVFRRDLDEGETERLAADDRIDEFRPFGFDVVATGITPRARTVALLTRADLKPEQDVGFFVADVYVLETRNRDRR